MEFERSAWRLWGSDPVSESESVSDPETGTGAGGGGARRRLMAEDILVIFWKFKVGFVGS